MQTQQLSKAPLQLGYSSRFLIRIASSTSASARAANIQGNSISLFDLSREGISKAPG
jgi:hypothetical protein